MSNCNQKIKQNIFISIKVSFVLLCFILVSMPSKSMESVQNNASVDFNKLPTPGTDAFWIHNPQNTTQKILLVPSNHQLNWRFGNKTLVEMIKSSDILITESWDPKENVTWNDDEIIRIALQHSLGDLKETQIIRGETEPPFELFNMPWTGVLEKLDPDSLVYLETNFRPFLEGIPLSHVHPYLVAQTLQLSWQIKQGDLGIDSQAARYFGLNNKTVLTLETREEFVSLVTEMTKKERLLIMKAAHQAPVNGDTLVDIAKSISIIKETDLTKPKRAYQEFQWKMQQMQSTYHSKKVPGVLLPEETLMAGIQRNKLWIPRLKSHLDTYNNKSIVIIVGVMHFVGDNGILKLLLDEGYIIRPFSEKTLTSAIARPVQSVEPKTEEEKNIVTAETQKEKIRAEYFVDFALKVEPPKLILDGRSADLSSIKNELISTMVMIIRNNPNKVRLQYRKLLNNYVMVRNGIYADTEITDKDRALEILKKNPNLNLDQLKGELK